MTQTKWQQRFMSLAEWVAGWSKDPSTQVGAVIVSPDRRQIHLGYNGLPAGVADTKERLTNRALKYTMVVHAEANAILNARQSVAGYDIYVWPLPPCNECAKLIIQAGISRVYFPATAKALERMCQHQDAMQMMEEAGLHVEML